MQVGVLFVEYEGRECFVVDGWTLKNLALSVGGDEKELIVWRESDGGDAVPEVEVGEDDSLDHVDDESKAVDIHANESAAVWR